MLIEGGTLEDGTKTKGIGGTFYVAPKQRVLDEETIAYTGLNVDEVAKKHCDAIITTMPAAEGIRALPPELQQALAAAQIVKQVREYVNAQRDSHPTLPAYISDNCIKPLPTWSNPKDDITLQNIQARVRLPTPWTIANKESKLALVTSNESEAVLGYTTAGGDMHMGGANPIGGVPKDDITRSLSYFEEHGLHGLSAVKSLHLINREKPSAELRKEDTVTTPQTDESDLGFSYVQSKVMEQLLIENRQTPAQVFAALGKHSEFPKEAGARRDILLKFTQRWEAAQFKRVMGTLAPHVGSNVDPHQAVRTTVLGDHFRTGMAQLTLEVMAAKLGGPEPFRRAFHMSLEQAVDRASLSKPFKDMLVSHSTTELLAPSLRPALKEAAATGAAVEALAELMPKTSERAIG